MRYSSFLRVSEPQLHLAGPGQCEVWLPSPLLELHAASGRGRIDPVALHSYIFSATGANQSEVAEFMVTSAHL